jgi:ABC-type multidrug transport system fused ATPase/permease subunit
MSTALARYRALLGDYLRPQAPQVLLLAVLLLTGIGLQLVNPQVIRYFIDTTQTGGVQGALLLAAGLYLGFALLRQVLAVGTAYTGQQVAWNATNRLRRDLTLHLLRLDMAFHKAHTPGELIDRVDGDVYSLSNFFSEFLVRVLGNVLLVAGILALLYAEDVRVGLGLTAYCVVSVVILATLQRPAQRRWAAVRQAGAEMSGYVEERISGTEDIRAAGAVDYSVYRLYDHLRAWLKAFRGAFMITGVIVNFTNLLSVAGYAIGLALAVWLYTRGETTIGTAFLIVSYTAMLSGPLQGIREQAGDLQQAAASVERVQALLALRPAVTDPVGAVPPLTLPGGPLSVTFESVAFHYEDDDQDVLHDVSFAVQPGRVLGVLGRTGSGKTTLTRLIFRLYDPTSGAVRLDGTDLRDLPVAEVRRRVGMVTQDVQLFQASIRDNLAFFNPGVDEDQLEQALRELRLWEWVKGRPQGLDTVLSAGGGGQSAGEAQLLAFARVFLKDPGVVVLDEASSRLDPATENLLERAVDRLFAGRTGLIIAHRLRTVQRADDILILEGGQVVEYGPRVALAADPRSRFYALLRTGLEEALA